MRVFHSLSLSFLFLLALRSNDERLGTNHRRASHILVKTRVRPETNSGSNSSITDHKETTFYESVIYFYRAFHKFLFRRPNIWAKREAFAANLPEMLYRAQTGSSDIIPPLLPHIVSDTLAHL